MIIVNYINISHVFFDDYSGVLNSLPVYMQNQLNSFYRVDDKKRYLAGKLILKKLLCEFGYSEEVLSHIKFDENNRPFIDSEIDFNISHSGEYVVCAISKNLRVGIDIEKIVNIDVDEIKDLVFNDVEMLKLKQESDVMSYFYDIWTIKEAALKATGKGLSYSMKNIEIKQNNLLYCEKNWTFEKVVVNPEYVCHIVYSGNKIDLLSENCNSYLVNYIY
jgi:4'-phosphopantetheinyl transferase